MTREELKRRLRRKNNHTIVMSTDHVRATAKAIIKIESSGLSMGFTDEELTDLGQVLAVLRIEAKA